MLTIDNETARRFILGKQGLWPGRRWRGLKGTEKAIRAMEHLQLDPLQIIARSQDIALYSRVLDYKPGHHRKFGYYTLPILWGDRLVARFDSKLERTTNTFVILGLWLEDKALSKNEAFAEALARGFGRLVKFLGASKMEVKTIREPLLCRRVSNFIH